ncbi:RHS repeat protein [Herbaspirillum frisingense]|uniref:RHS repeat protein n=1 Tax=Herbaspirillum frisingense TaxID=92645 RepID=UPI0015FED2E9|nr:RHS repeat protein [Herbaspirillum frisingense]QNB06087.1 RHS repeat protein [Herbaspirillum frisingense]
MATKFVSGQCREIGQVEIAAGRKVSPLQPEEASQIARVVRMLPPDQQSSALATIGTIVPDSDRLAALAKQMHDKDNTLGLAMMLAGDPEGRAIEMTYDANGNQITQKDASGNLIERRYDTQNQLIEEALSNGSGNGDREVTRYVYDAGNHHLLRFVLTPKGRVTEYRYDTLGQRISALQHLTYYDLSAAGPSLTLGESAMVAWVSSQDARSAQRTDMQYDGRGLLNKVISYSTINADGSGSADGAINVQYFYDQAGQLLKRIAGDGGVFSSTYDGRGQLIAQNDAGQLTLTGYDDLGNSVATTAANGLLTTRVFDAAGRLLSVTQSGSGAVAATTHYSYDALGQLTESVDPLGNRQRVFYDASGRKQAEINAKGTVTEYSYNRAGQLTSTRIYAATVDLSLLTDQGGTALYPDYMGIRPTASSADHTVWRTYDTVGRLSKEINAQGAVTSTRYDNAGRIISTTNYAVRVNVSLLGSSPVDTDIQVVSDGEDRVTRYFYEDGLLRGTLDPEGYLTEASYNDAGQQIQKIRYANLVPVDKRVSASLSELRPSRDPVRDAIERTVRNGRGEVVGTIDAQGYLTEIRYDANGNVARTIRYANVAQTFKMTCPRKLDSSELERGYLFGFY